MKPGEVYRFSVLCDTDGHEMLEQGHAKGARRFRIGSPHRGKGFPWELLRAQWRKLCFLYCNTLRTLLSHAFAHTVARRVRRGQAPCVGGPYRAQQPVRDPPHVGVLQAGCSTRTSTSTTTTNSNSSSTTTSSTTTSTSSTSTSSITSSHTDGCTISALLLSLDSILHCRLSLSIDTEREPAMEHVLKERTEVKDKKQREHQQQQQDCGRREELRQTRQLV